MVSQGKDTKNKAENGDRPMSSGDSAMELPARYIPRNRLVLQGFFLQGLAGASTGANGSRESTGSPVAAEPFSYCADKFNLTPTEVSESPIQPAWCRSYGCGFLALPKSGLRGQLREVLHGSSPPGESIQAATISRME